MASKFARDRGFEEERFELSVSENFKCAICLNILNNPKGCRNNQHYFCFGCIGEHLKNSHTCPECMEELTPATLVQPPRVLLNCISELRIKCSYSSRGCLEYVKLGNLQTHVDQCGFAPAKCGNEGCGAEVNECEKVRHETELCKFRKVECYGCGELKKEIQELKGNQEKIKNMEEKQIEMDRKMAEVLDIQSRMKEGVKEAFKESLNKIESIFDATQSDSRSTQSAQGSKPDVVRLPWQSNHGINHDIFVMGGRDKDNKPTNSVEKFCSKDRIWVDVAPMNVPRASASSVVVGNQVIVSGGTTGKNVPTDSIEILNLDQCPLRWVMSDVKLPAPAADHQTFIYEGKLIVICRCFEKEEFGLNGCKFFEVPLTPPHASKELFTLPSQRFLPSVYDFYKAELVNEKLFVFGGISGDSKGVLIYDLVANECQDAPGLPIPMFGMATVLWRDQIILLGGKNRVLSDRRWVDETTKKVTIYNPETGESDMLPAMKHTRNGCSAVVTDDVIVAMGGHYNSVEFYDFRTNNWQALKAMKKIRIKATAVVSPL